MRITRPLTGTISLLLSQARTPWETLDSIRLLEGYPQHSLRNKITLGEFLQLRLIRLTSHIMPTNFMIIKRTFTRQSSIWRKMRRPMCDLERTPNPPWCLTLIRWEPKSLNMQIQSTWIMWSSMSEEAQIWAQWDLTPDQPIVAAGAPTADPKVLAVALQPFSGVPKRTIRSSLSISEYYS